MGTKIYTKAEREKMERESKALAPAPSGKLLSVEKAQQFLAQSRDVDEVRDVADKAKAVQLYLRSRNASIESQNDAAEIRLRAERRLGELTRGMPKQTGGDAAKARSKNATEVKAPPTLAEQGIDKRDASKWQQLAAIPPKKFDRLVADTREKGERLTSSTPLKLAKQERKADLVERVRAEPAPMPTGPFRIIVADWPWQYEKRDGDTTSRGHVDYPTMTVDEAIAWGPRIQALSHDDAILCFWTTNAFMEATPAIVRAWGFTWKTILTWDKERMGLGDWLRGQTEHCVVAARGNPVHTLNQRTTLLRGELREHSRKPESFYELVDACCPGSKLELFAREPRDGWARWGAESEKFATEAA